MSEYGIGRHRIEAVVVRDASDLQAVSSLLHEPNSPLNNDFVCFGYELNVFIEKV
jgi:hypothetical protein